MRDHDAEFGGVFTSADTVAGVFIEFFRDLHDAGFTGTSAAAAADKDIDVIKRIAVLFQDIENDLFAEGHLAIDMRIF